MSQSVQPGGPAPSQPLFKRAFASLTLYRNYRLMWFGSLTEHMGEWMEIAALLWLVNQMTHSPLMLTLVGSLRYAPLVVFSFLGGITADRVNRRNLLICSLLSSATLSIVLAVLVRTGMVTVWHLLIISTLDGVTTAFNHPSRQSLMPNMVKREHLLNAVTVDSGAVMASRIIATPLAGLSIARWGTTPVFGLRAVGALVAIVWLLQIKTPPTPEGARRAPTLKNLKEGLSYVTGNKGVLAQLLLYLLPYFVTNSYTNLLPYFATDVLHIGPALYGLMQAAPGLGAVLATFSLALLGNISRKGLAQMVCAVVQGVTLLAFGFSRWLALSLPLLVAVGAMNTMFMTLNATIIQEMISDQVRGRVMSLREVSSGLGPSASILSGSVAELVSAPMATGLVGLIAVVVPVSLLFTIPRLRRG